VNCTVNFIGPNDAGMGSWLRKQVDAHVFDGRSLVVDFHNYYNWDAPIKTFASAMARVCATKSGAEADWSQYADANLSTLIGEWSNAIAQNSHATSDIDDATQRAAMSKLWADQVSLFESVPGGRTAGQFYWTIRQGSGWDPRPALNSTAAATSSSRSTTTMTRVSRRRPQRSRRTFPPTQARKSPRRNCSSRHGSSSRRSRRPYG
jgi:hypothetical protein